MKSLLDKIKIDEYDVLTFLALTAVPQEAWMKAENNPAVRFLKVLDFLKSKNIQN